ncbi:MAG: SMEK domain-containing protein [Peptostreptococcaceae bacterium]|nr:SMEK domain-containing protein [Peptostreptococcaceae bacterium]
MVNYESAIPIREEMINSICSRLTQIERLVELLNSAGMYDINRVSEDYFCGLFNILYDLKLVNLNAIKENYPGIDLGDRSEKIAMQVTTTRRREKTEKTIKNFIEKKYYSEYDTLWVFVIGRKTEFRNPFDTEGMFSFDHKKHVIDLSDIAKKVSHSTDATLRQLVAYLDEAHNNYSSLQAISETVKIECELCEGFISRPWISKKYRNKGMLDFQRERLSERPLDVIRSENRVALLSDAGNGKTQEACALTNLINENEEDLFAFCFKLKQYDGQKIEELIPDQYSKLPIQNVVFVLDGYDEIGDQNVSTSFRKKLNIFTSSKPDVKVVVTSRTNHYSVTEAGFDGTLNDFEEYFIENLTFGMLENYVDRRGLDREAFFSQINAKSLNGIVTNAFFAVEIVKLYKSNPVLPERKFLLKGIIEKSIKADLTHHEFNSNEADFDNLPMLLRKVGFVNECLGRNNLSEEEFKKVFADRTAKELIKRSSLWKKGVGDWAFIHNNFGEFFAAELLSKVPFESCKQIIGTGVDFNYLKPTWINTISFLADMSNDEGLTNWIIEGNISLIAHFESDRLGDDAKEQIFAKYYAYYNTRKIWLPYEIRSAISDAGLVCEKSIVELLLEDIEENKHFTIVANAISVLGGLKTVFGLGDVIKQKLVNVCNSGKYRKYEIKDAIEVLADLGYINQAELEDIITQNATKEEQYLRTGYFHAINALGLSDNMIEYIFDVYDKVNSHDEDESTLIDQDMQYERLFASLKDEKSVERTLTLLEKKRDRFDFSSSVISGLLKSLRYNFKRSSQLAHFVSKLYIILEKGYGRDIRDVVKLINELQINSAIIELLLSDGSIRHINSIETVLDKKSVELIVSYYSSDEFDQNIAKSIIVNLDAESPMVLPIFEVHKTVTGEDRLERVHEYRKTHLEAEKSKDSFVEAIFDRERLGEYIDSLVEDLFEGDTVTVEGLYDHDRISASDYNDIYREVANLLRMQFKSDEVVNSKMLESLEWDHFVLNAIYQRHRNRRDFILEGDTLFKLKDICLKGIQQYRDKPIMTFTNGEYKGIYWHAIFLALLYFKYGFDYDEFFLLEMIRIDSVYFHQVEDSFNKIVAGVREHKLTEKVVKNIEFGYMRGTVLKDHLEYCINKKVELTVDSVKAYLDVKTDDIIGRKACYRYLIFIKGASWFMEAMYTSVSDDLRTEVQRLLIEEDTNAVIPILMDQLKSSNEESIRMQAAKNLMKCNDIRGLEYYYNWIVIHNSSYIQNHSYDSINNAVGEFVNPDGIVMLADICTRSLATDFIDDDFDHLYRYAKTALKTIAEESKEQVEKVIMVIDEAISANNAILNIGFMNNIIEEIRSDEKYKNYRACTLDEALNYYEQLTH